MVIVAIMATVVTMATLVTMATEATTLVRDQLIQEGSYKAF